MKTVKLYHILFEAEDTLNLDIGKDVADAVTKAIEPLSKDVEQMKKDINVIQQGTGERKQEPTKARSTTGPDQTTAATSVPKGPGTTSATTIKPATTERDEKPDKELNRKVEDIDKKLQSLVARSN